MSKTGDNIKKVECDLCYGNKTLTTLVIGSKGEQKEICFKCNGEGVIEQPKENKSK